MLEPICRVPTITIQNFYKLIFLGRNSIFQKYNFSPSNHLNLIIKDKLPFSWLGAYELLNGKEIILGFSTDKFIIYNQTRRRIIFEVNCGGGHRLWDYHLTNNYFTLTYQKVDKLISIEFNLESEVRNVLESFHGTETNCMKLIVTKSTPFTCFCISGGEDTTLRLSKINFEDELNGFEVVNVIKSHLSSIRVVIYHQINFKEYFVFSGGGRAQIILWKLNVFGENIIFKELFSYYKELDEFESEIRIMDLTTIEVNNKIVLFSACSNGDIKIYEIGLINPEIKYLFKIAHKKRCILKLFTIKFGNISFLVSTSTDGYINFFNISDLENLNNSFVAEFKTNQSGINSTSFCYLPDNKAVILTGGDDKAFSLNLIECNNATINRLSYYSNENHHFAHITGAFITKSHFITASIDQKVIVFHWELINNQFEVKEVCKRFTHITDLQGIDYVFNDNKLKLVLFGNGFEIFSVNLE
nr:uncharacterized WD repeat-containing protein C1306.02-like [Onthophagus taurus]